MKNIRANFQLIWCPIGEVGFFLNVNFYKILPQKKFCFYCNEYARTSLGVPLSAPKCQKYFL